MAAQNSFLLQRRRCSQGSLKLLGLEISELKLVNSYPASFSSVLAAFLLLKVASHVLGPLILRGEKEQQRRQQQQQGLG